jgi:uncharacterized protein YciI
MNRSTWNKILQRKRILFISGLITLIGTGFAAVGSLATGQQKQSLFAGIFKATNPDFIKKGPRPEERQALRQHVEYLQRLTDQGISIVAGHTLNQDESAFGLAVVRADSEAAARKIMEDDALVRAGIVTVTVFPFQGLTGKNLQPASSQPPSTFGPETRSLRAGEPVPADVKALISMYFEAAGEKQFDRLPALLDPDMEFSTPGKTIRGAQDYIAALRRLSPITLRNDVKKIWVDGNEICVIYDFVTDTAVGAVPSVEWLTVESGRIRSVRLVFHSQVWPAVLDELSRRTKRASGENK